MKAKSKEFLELLAAIGKNIQELRKKSNMSVEEVSKITGIRVSYLEKIEKGEAYRLNTNHLSHIAKALGVNECSLMDK